jgi:hypothetical protein
VPQRVSSLRQIRSLRSRAICQRPRVIELGLNRRSA